MKNTKYSVKNLRADFDTDGKCLDFIFDMNHSPSCSCGGTYKRVKGRKQYQCSKCRFQIAPTAGTIFHKSDTPLTLWFHAIWVFSNAKSGISAKEMERQLGVTYKCAWRILSLIRKALPQDNNFLEGIVETDQAYLGGKKKVSERMSNKSTVLGAVERGGKARLKVSNDSTAKSIWKFLDENVNPITTRLMTDKGAFYKQLKGKYDHESVNHSKKEYVRGEAHINTMEAFFAHVKRSVSGTYKVISKKHLQSYLDSFVFHYNNRRNDSERFSLLLGSVLRASR